MREAMDLLRQALLSLISSLVVFGLFGWWIDRRGERRFARMLDRMRVQDQAVATHGRSVDSATAKATAATLETQTLGRSVSKMLARVNSHTKALNTLAERLASIALVLARGGPLPMWVLMLDKSSDRPTGEPQERATPQLVDPPPDDPDRIERSIADLRAQEPLSPENARLVERWEQMAIRARAEATEDARARRRAMLLPVASSTGELDCGATLESARSPFAPQPLEPPPDERTTWEDATRVLAAESAANPLAGVELERPVSSVARTVAAFDNRHATQPGPVPLLASLTNARTDADARKTRELPRAALDGPSSPRRPVPTLASVRSSPHLPGAQVTERWIALRDHARGSGLATDHCLSTETGCNPAACPCYCDGCRRAVALLDQARREVLGATT